MPVGEVADGSAPRATSPTLSIRRLAFSSRNPRPPPRLLLLLLLQRSLVLCTYVRMCVCTYVRMYVCTYVRMYVCTYVWIVSIVLTHARTHSALRGVAC